MKANASNASVRKQPKVDQIYLLRQREKNLTVQVLTMHQWDTTKSRPNIPTTSKRKLTVQVLIIVLFIFDFEDQLL